MKEKIQKTSGFRSKLKNRLKFICGSRVKIGKTYKGLHITEHSETKEGPYKTLCYENGMVVAFQK